MTKSFLVPLVEHSDSTSALVNSFLRTYLNIKARSLIAILN